MKVELYVCPNCDQMKLRNIASGTAGRRELVCGGEHLERANGGQTHDWTAMSFVGVFELTAVKA